MEALKYNRWFSLASLNIISIILLLFAVLRDGSIVGTDSPAYFLNYKYDFWQTEPAYKFLNRFFSRTLAVQYNWFLLFLNSISLLLIAKYLRRNTIFFALPLLIFFSDLYLYFNISGIRQAMALSFVCFSLYYAIKRNLKVFLLLIGIAATFHVSSLVFAFAYFIPKTTFRFKQILLLGVFFAVAVVVGNYLAANFEYLTTKADYYTKYQEQSENIAVNYVVGIAKRSVILLLAFIYRKRLFTDKKFIYIFNIYLVGFLIFVGTYLISPDFGVRFSVYYTIHEIVLAGMMLAMIKGGRQRIFIVAVFSAICMYKLVGYMNNEYYTYKSIIDYL
ncbi:EpsG family protein [Chryseobacterium taklimakanense]|uniref:EpsG family protein n=1 Tax=Chryseobacterium taklimakanense TaxID=536441 RepID=UPI0013DE72EF|nr:EpsG family protein [Chryseobacterium taklimakanense]